MKCDIETFYQYLSSYFNFHIYQKILIVALYKRQQKFLCESRMYSANIRQLEKYFNKYCSGKNPAYFVENILCVSLKFSK